MSRTSTELTTLSAPAMGSRWTARLAAPPEGLAAALAAAVERIEAAASLWRPDSALCRLNAAPVGVWVGLPPALLDLLALALRLGGRTGGLFDIAMGGLTAAWGFGAAQGRMDPAAMSAPPRAPGATAAALELDMPNRRARKHAPLTLTLDGIAKGHAVDAMAEIALAQGVTRALFGLDGELRALGPRPDGRPWGIAVEAPDPDRRAAAAVIEIADSALASSGDYRHFVRVGGRRVGHTMNPRTGLPAHGAPAVTVLAPTCAEADAWATALLILPPEAGRALAASNQIPAHW
ncbi:FAD:protein FMN transferase [Paracoccus contaminans]|uniref:FAD:protein FMN transferase n=1 Tax=Paracoccus contaminans TaxID=1945662 RepID=A0A1W6CXZ0_9RHOB|nr:FAD:protein FMN transferase [Paracoccus contaminans]ARJ69722.1 hypothetical protein B0A89_08900 [Paracoccus contaminans]